MLYKFQSFLKFLATGNVFGLFVGRLSLILLLLSFVQPAKLLAETPTERLLRIKAKQEGRLYIPPSKEQDPAERLFLIMARQQGLPVLQEGDENLLLVQGLGVGTWLEKDPATSRKKAIKDALQNAVETASGVLLEASSEVQNYELIQEKLVTKSSGFIKRYSVKSEKRDGPFYRVEVEALVQVAPLVKEADSQIENEKNSNEKNSNEKLTTEEEKQDKQDSQKNDKDDSNKNNRDSDKGNDKSSDKSSDKGNDKDDKGSDKDNDKSSDKGNDKGDDKGDAKKKVESSPEESANKAN